jgi:hypothetical protein
MQQHSPESSSRRECVQQRWEDSAERRDPAIPRRPGSLRDGGSWGSRAKDFVICAEAALRGKKGVLYLLNNSSLGRWVG